MPLMPIRAVGIPWYRRDDWLDVRRIMVDADRLPKTYEDWLQRAEQTLDVVASQGGIAEKVYLDPTEFAVWCRARGLNVDAAARMKFASEAVALKYSNKS